MEEDELLKAVLAIEAERRKVYEARSKITPQRQPRASAVGPCTRELVYQVTHWQQQARFGQETLQRFRRGTEIESINRRELSALGAEVELSQMTAEIRDADGTLLCTCHQDGELQITEAGVVLEHKSLNANIVNRMPWDNVDGAMIQNAIRTFGWFDEGPAWARKYPNQILLYMHARKKRHGVMLIDDCLGHWFWVTVDMNEHQERLQAILARLREAVDAIAAIEAEASKPGALGPDGKPKHLDSVQMPHYHGELDVCRQCWAYRAGICLPPMLGDATIQIVEDESLLEDLEVVRANREAAKAHDAAEKRLKLVLREKGPGEWLLGDATIVNKQRSRKGYSVAPTTYVECKIVLGADGDDRGHG